MHKGLIPRPTLAVTTAGRRRVTAERSLTGVLGKRFKEGVHRHCFHACMPICSIEAVG